jgi:hypothetical protein
VVPPCSDRVSRAPPYSRIQQNTTPTGLSPTLACLSRHFGFFLLNHWPTPLSLATTRGISVDVFSFGYLDVSVPRVCLPTLWIQAGISLRRGFPIRTSADQRSLASPRGFSQRATSFIASWRQGIHRTPLSRSRSHTTARTQDQTAPTRSTPCASAEMQPEPTLSHTLAYAYQPILSSPVKDHPPTRQAPPGQAPSHGGFGSAHLSAREASTRLHHA